MNIFYQCLLFLRWWFLRSFEDLSIEKSKSKSFTNLKMIPVTLFTDPTAEIWPWECLKEAACDPGNCSAHRLWNVNWRKSTNSREAKTKIYQWQRRKAREKFLTILGNSEQYFFFLSEKQAKTVHLFISLKWQTKNLKTFCACKSRTSVLI